MPLLDRLDPRARAIGAVNTIVRGDDGALTGNNTDVAGFLEPLRADLAQRICSAWRGCSAPAVRRGRSSSALADEGFAHRAGRARPGQGARAAR